MRRSRGPPVTDTTVLLASLKSVSSVAAQNTGATGTPIACSRALANASALSAFDSVLVGPPDKPGSRPVVTTPPRPFADASSLCFAFPVASKAGASRVSQSCDVVDRTVSARSRQDSAPLGVCSYQPGGAAPEINAAASAFPPIV